MTAPYHRRTPIQSRVAQPMTVLLAPAKATLLNFGIWIGIGTLLAAIHRVTPLVFVLVPLATQPILVLLQLRDPHYMGRVRGWSAARRLRLRAANEIDRVAGRLHLA